MDVVYMTLQLPSVITLFKTDFTGEFFHIFNLNCVVNRLYFRTWWIKIFKIKVFWWRRMFGNPIFWQPFTLFFSFFAEKTSLNLTKNWWLIIDDSLMMTQNGRFQTLFLKKRKIWILENIKLTALGGNFVSYWIMEKFF